MRGPAERVARLVRLRLSGSGVVTGESQMMTPATRSAWQRRGGDRDEAAHAVADHDRRAVDARRPRRRPPPRRSTARAGSSVAVVAVAVAGQVDGHARGTRRRRCAATCVHQWACAPPPCTNTRPRRPRSPQAR